MDTEHEKRFGIVFSSQGLLGSSAADLAPNPRVRLTHWPLDSQKLEKPTSSQWASIALDVVLITTPLILICKTVLCIFASRVDASAAGQHVDQVHSITLYLIHFNFQLTTIFTIVFVTIISTLVRRIALWRAQTGASVAELELWQASISLPSTLMTIWSLQTYTFKSLALVFIWSWYYLGSQASTREYKHQEADSHAKIQVTVTNPQGPSYLDGQFFSTLNNSQISGSNARFTNFVAPLGSVGPLEMTGYDRNGLMKIPFIDQVTPKADRNGFFEVFDASKVEYATLVGVQTYGIFPGVDYVWTNQIIGDLSFNSSYLDVKCSPMRARSLSEFPAGVLPQMAVSLNMTEANNSLSSPTTFEAWYRTSNITAEIQAMSSDCAITVVLLEIQAQCTAQGCVVKKLKPINIDKSASYRTNFDNKTYAANFFNEMLLSTGIPSNQQDQSFAEAVAWSQNYFDHLPDGSYSLVSELDVLTASLPANIQAAATAHQYTVPTMKKLWKIVLDSKARFRSRAFMTPMINAYLATYQQDSYAYNAVRATSSSLDGFYATINGSVASPWLTVANLDGTYWNPRYALSIPWIVVDFISCTVLLVAGIAAVWLRTRTLAPDILGYVSSLTRDNPYVPLPHMASSLDGLERARILKNVKVRIADIEANSEVGRVCLTRVEPCAQNASAGKLRRNRWYV